MTLTIEQVIALQRGRRDWLGNKLKVDGVYGPKTAWAVMYSGLPTWRRNVLEVCQLLVGLQETDGANLHPLITNMLRLADTGPGNSWCAAAASAALRLGALSLWESRMGKTCTGVAGALELQRRLIQVKEPAPGDVAAYPTDAEGHGHVFVVAGVSATELLTYEGNQRNEFRFLRRPRAPELRYGSLGLDKVPDHLLESLGESVELVAVKPEGTR